MTHCRINDSNQEPFQTSQAIRAKSTRITLCLNGHPETTGHVPTTRQSLSAGHFAVNKRKTAREKYSPNSLADCRIGEHDTAPRGRPVSYGVGTANLTKNTNSQSE